MDIKKNNNVQFSATLRALNPISPGFKPFYTYFWEFGDGTFCHDSTGKERAPLHRYRTSGNYQVSLFATNNYDNGEAPSNMAFFNVPMSNNGNTNRTSSVFKEKENTGNIKMKSNRDPRHDEEFVAYIGYRNRSRENIGASLVIFFDEYIFAPGSFSLSGLSGIENLKNLQSLTLSSFSINSLRDIEKLKTLKVLNLSDIENVNSFSFIKNLTKLQSLKLEKLSSFSSLSDLESLDSLTSLSLVNLKSLSSLSGIGNLKSLQSLKLTSLRMDSLTGIENLKNVRSLYLDDISKSGILFIPSLSNQNSLDTLTIYKIKLESLGFIYNKLGLKIFIYKGDLGIPKNKDEFSIKTDEMNLTRFHNEDLLGASHNITN